MPSFDATSYKLAGAEEKDALLKLIDMAISKKKLKDNLTNLIAS